MRPCVTRIELNVVIKRLVGADQQSIVVRGTGVLVGTDGSEPGIRPGTEEEESRMGRIGGQGSGISIEVAEGTEGKHAAVLVLLLVRGGEVRQPSAGARAYFLLVEVSG